MTEPLTAGLGIKAASLVGGAIGSAITLANLPKMGPCQRMIAYGTGLAAAVYIPPFMTYFMGLPALLDGPMGFVAGTAGMGLVGAIIQFGADPIGVWRKIKSRETQP